MHTAQSSRRVQSVLLEPTGISVVALVDAIIFDAFLTRSSDVHLDPQDNGLAVRFRIDGILQHIALIPKSHHNEVISRIKILSALRTDEHQAAQDGRFRLSSADGTVDVRVSIAPTYYGENAVMRLLSDSAEEFTLEALGFSIQNAEKVRRAAQLPYGMILATGPTGSGKTTTLYTLVKMLNTPDSSIVTIEDPIEYSIGGINQIQVNPRTNLTFASGLRALLRQDPNIIMVGEIRDVETAGIAVNTALTGHLVLSTLHTNDAPTTLPRLLDMKVEPYLIASTVNLAIGQRLVRTICSACKQEYMLSEHERASLSATFPEKSLDTKIFFQGSGCEACGGTGYRGRIGIQEVMELSQPLRDAILDKASAAHLRSIATAHGMIPMLEDGLEKARAGLTTLSEIIRMRYE